VGAPGASGAVLVSGTVEDLVACSGVEFIERVNRQLKGVPRTWKRSAVKG
jgi:hypothetical protein